MVQKCIKLIVIEFGINVLVFVNDKILDEIFYLNTQRQIFCFALTTSWYFLWSRQDLNGPNWILVVMGFGLMMTHQENGVKNCVVFKHVLL